MISILTEEKTVSVAVSSSPRSITPPTVTTTAGTVTPPAISAPAPPVVDVQVVATAPTPNFLFTHQQTTPATEWSIPHTLGVRPASIQVEVGGLPIIPDVIELSDIRVVLLFGEPSVGLVSLLKGS